MRNLRDEQRERNDAREFFRRLAFTPDPDAPPSERNPVKAIRRMCLDCSGGSARMVEECPSATCPLFPWRLGRNPYRLAAAVGDSRILDDASASADGCDDEQ